jgi:hypothetical protein
MGTARKRKLPVKKLELSGNWPYGKGGRTK